MPAIATAGIVFVALTLLSPAVAALGQSSTASQGGSGPTPGSRVRVVVVSGAALVRGVVLAADETSLTLAPHDRVPLRLPLDAITGWEVRVGQKRNMLRGLVIGGVGMGALGLTFSMDPDDCGGDSVHFCSRAEAVGASALLGVMLGAAIGALIETEQWMPLGARLRVPGASEHRRRGWDCRSHSEGAYAIRRGRHESGPVTAKRCPSFIHTAPPRPSRRIEAVSWQSMQATNWSVSAAA